MGEILKPEFPSPRGEARAATTLFEMKRRAYTVAVWLVFAGGLFIGYGL